VCPHNKVKVMAAKKLTDHIPAKGKGHSTVIFIPPSDGRVRICPEDVTEKTCVRHITRSSYVSDLFHLTQLRTQATMHANNFVINDSCTWKAIEGVAKGFPELDTETATTFVIETINPVDSRALVVASKNEKVFWVLDLVGKQQAHDLKRLLASVNVITEKEIVRLRRKPTIFEQSQEISILAVYITANFYGGPQL
jgi:hypothetical protein